MNNELNNLLYKASLKCNNHYAKDDYALNFFSSIYPFTTENINGYIREFNLENKSLLTVGSSSDQVIDSACFNCDNHTVLDINPYSKYYFYLKKAGLLGLDYKEFLTYFCYKDFPKTFSDNKYAFNIEIFNKFKDILRNLDYDSYYFWSLFFSGPKPLGVTTKLFNDDEEKLNVLREINYYLKNEFNFNEAKDKIQDINPRFINGDILDTDINDKFDNIWFSNIGTWESAIYLKKLLDKFSNNLNIDGKILICYLYDTVKDTKYLEEWNPIYDLEKTLNILSDYVTDFISFIGVKGILHQDNDWKDSVLIYKKTK